ncbi:MAG: hypothetical protein AAFR32_10845, partial [Pseudomonadota bacterium]
MADEIEPQRFIIDTEEKLAIWTGDIGAWNAEGEARGWKYFEPLDPGTPVHPMLFGEAAMALWRAGREEWNAWVERNPKADVDFGEQKF